jgi:hypothetical protein
MTEKRSATAWLALALLWAVVAIPAAWGVAQVVAKSMALFR